MRSHLLRNFSLIFFFCGIQSIILCQSYSGGDGTEANPYIINSKTDLIYLSQTKEDWDKNFVQTADITFNVDESMEDWNGDGAVDENDDFGFSPIGVSQIHKFSGTYNGNEYKISNLYIYIFAENLGLFGFIEGENAKVENLALLDCNVSGTNYIGSLIGNNNGSKISNCYSTGSVSGLISGSIMGSTYIGGLIGVSNNSTVTDCNSFCDVWGYSHIGGLLGECSQTIITNSNAQGHIVGNDYLGGLIGSIDKSCTISGCTAIGNIEGDSDLGGLIGSIDNGCTISKCSAEGNIEGDRNLGGLVGVNGDSCTISDSYAVGDVVGDYGRSGGLVGTNYATIIRSYADGNVSGNNFIGGLSGASYSKISNCYATGNVNGGSDTGGLVGRNDNSGEIENCYATGSIVGVYFTGGLVGVNGEFAIISNCIAFNQDVSGSSYINRLVGSNIATLFNNYANIEMTVNGNTTTNLVEGTEVAIDLTKAEFSDTSSYNNDGVAPDLNWDPNGGIWRIDLDGKINNGFPFLAWQNPSDGIPLLMDDNENLLTEFKLNQNYPNPFNPTTTISYTLPRRGFVQLKVYNILGQEVANLVNKGLFEGTYNIEFDATNLTSGIYLYSLQSGDNIVTKKMILIR